MFLNHFHRSQQRLDPVSSFLATPLACCFESLKIKRDYDVYCRHRADVIHFNHLMLILSTVNSRMRAPIF